MLVKKEEEMERFRFDILIGYSKRYDQETDRSESRESGALAVAISLSPYRKPPSATETILGASPVPTPEYESERRAQDLHPHRRCVPE